MALIAFLSFILGRPVFFLFLFLDGNNGVILFHKTSGTSYSDSTPVISDITIDHKRVQYGLGLSYKYSMAKTQLISITFRIGSNTIIGMIYVSNQLSYVSDIIQPSPYGVYLLHNTYIYTSSLAILYTISSGVTFVLFWLGTVLLLQSYRKRLGTIKFWIIMIVPLRYFLSQFQPLVTGVLLDYSYGNPMLYSIVYVLMLEVSRPIGGLLFGLA